MKKFSSIFFIITLLVSFATAVCGETDEKQLQLVWTQIEEAQNPVTGSDETDTLNVSALIYNLGNTKITNAEVLAAVYDNERLIGVSTTKVTVEPTSTTETKFTLACGLDDDIYKQYTTKMFVWDNLEDLTPLSEADKGKHTRADYFTTTTIKPWLKTLHLTSDTKAQLGIKGGEDGQLVYCFGVSPHDENIIVAGTDTVGVWRSVDGGNTWENSSEGLVYVGLNDLLYDTENEGVIYAINPGSTNALKSDYTDYGIYKSTDDGNSWELELNVRYSLTALGGRNQLEWGTYNGTRYLYAVTMGDGIYRKADNGKWEQVYYNETVSEDITDETEIDNTKISNNTFYDIYVGQDFMLAVGKTGLVKSTNGGASWTAIESNVVEGFWIWQTTTPIIPKSITVNPSNSQYWICVTDTTIYKTENGGESWSKVREQFSSGGEAKFVNVKFSDYYAENSQNPRLYFMCWSYSQPLRYADDLGVSEFNAPAFTDYTGNVKTTHAYWPEAIDVPGKDGVMKMYHSGLATSTDGGETYSIIPPQGVSGVPITDIHFSEGGKPQWFSSIDSGLWKAESGNADDSLYSTIKQHNFIRFNGTALDTGSMSSSAVEIDPNDSNHILAVTGNYGYGSNTVVVQSYDGGQTWEAVEKTKNINLSFLKYDLSDATGKTIYAGNLKSTDNGKTWNQISPVAEGETPLHVCDISKNGYLLAYRKENTDKNIYISKDGGNTWTSYVTELSGVYGGITTANFDIFDDNVVWAGKYDSLYRFDLSKDISNASEYVKKSKKAYSVRKIAQDPKDKNHLIFVNKDVSYYRLTQELAYETFDGGATWHTIEGLAKNANVTDVFIHPTENIAYFSTYIGTLVYNYEYYRNYLNTIN